MKTSDLVNLWGAYIFLFGVTLVLFSSAILFFLRRPENSDSNLPTAPFHWYFWPAIAANAFFTRLFGPRGAGLKGLLTWRSIIVTLLFSTVANLLCIWFILTSAPDDAPAFDLELIRILTFSHLVFMLFNFFGDLVSVSVTRHAVDRIVSLRKHYARYLLLDILGVVLGYLVNFLPGLLAFVYAAQTDVTLNQLIHAGLFGNALIPFFLLIFATTTMPFPFAVFAFVAVFSITIPTAIYLFLILFVNLGYRLYRGGQTQQYLRMRKAFRYLYQAGKRIKMCWLRSEPYRCAIYYPGVSDSDRDTTARGFPFSGVDCAFTRGIVSLALR